jgi:hypothetical protein
VNATSPAQPRFCLSLMIGQYLVGFTCSTLHGHTIVLLGLLRSSILTSNFPAGRRRPSHQVYYTLIGTHLVRIKKKESDACWWCDSGRKQSRGHLFGKCRAWKRECLALKKRVERIRGRRRKRGQRRSDRGLPLFFSLRYEAI